MSVVVYTTNHCPECNILKKFLKDYQIEYEVRNCSLEPQLLQDIKRMGFLGVPVTLVKGTAIQGFKPEEIMNALRQD